jgi:hypothetical protein
LNEAVALLKLLLDEHISPKVARQLTRKFPDLTIMPMRDWQAGRFMGVQDEVWIPAAISDGLTLVTYDRASITPLLRAYADQGISHAGVVFVDNLSIPQWNLGALVKALASLWRQEGKKSWIDRVVFLKSL